MIFAWLVRIVAVLVVLTVIYLALSLFKRWEERKRLNADFGRQAQSDNGAAKDREAFVQEGLRTYESSLRKKLLLGVYVIPFALILLLVAVAQWG